MCIRDRFAREAIAPASIGADPAWFTPAGELRTLPFHLPTETTATGGMDGFYAARLRRAY